MKLLVTGGAGYIGGFVTRQLLRDGHEVTVVDDLSTGHRTAAGNAELIAADLGDRLSMRDVLADRDIETVLHLGGLKSVGHSWLEPTRYLQVNVAGTIALLSAMAEAGVHMFVYSSSCAVYGDPATLPVDESQPASPLNPYAQSKWLAEQTIAAASAAGRLRYVVLRYFNAAGAEPDGTAGEDPRGATNLVPLLMKAALGQNPHVTIYGTDYPTPDGSPVRDYVHVLDLAAVHRRSLEYLADGSPSIAVNVGTGTGTSVRQMVAAAERASGRSIPVVEAGRRAGDPAASWASVQLARQTLGWESQHDVEDIVTSAWRWACDHPQGYA